MSKVYVYGMVTPSIVYKLRDDFSYPEKNKFAEIKTTYPSIGGEAANSAIMLSKFGVKAKLDGNYLKPCHAARVIRTMKGFNVDVSRLRIKENCGTEEFVVTDKDSRTVFGNYASFAEGDRQWNDPDEGDIRRSDYIAIDPFFKKESRAAAEICVKYNKPYVCLDCRHDDYITKNAAAMIITYEVWDKEYKGADLGELFKKYIENSKGLMIFTFGSRDLWYARPGEKVRKFKPFNIKPVDTAGAGDSFRAGIIYGLMQGWEDARTIEFASAVAACVCMTIPHALGAPGLKGVLDFIDQNKKS
ncbi:MAG: PfkB family carbohydrate kinase [Brevinematales bacterium]|jgi:sugar/nucleoside kinase (ribokinase family)